MKVESQRFISRLTRDTLALVLAGGRGTRLKDLTAWRAKPAVPFGGKFRIIDFPLANCLNSGIRRIAVLTQYKAHSLIQHVQKGWGFLRGEFNEFVEIWPAQQRLDTSWYAGTADAVYQNLDIIRKHDPEYILVLAGDHIYKMDYGELLAYHVDTSADLTVACLEVGLDEASAYGVMGCDETGKVYDFAEKPEKPTPMPGRNDCALASMGVYVFNAAFLYEQLIHDADMMKSNHDFGQDLIPHAVSKYRVMAFPYRDTQQNKQAYWRDVGTVDAYWGANLELIGITPELNLYDQDWPIWTYQEQLPPAKFIFDDEDRRGTAVDSMVSGGCIISGSTVRHSLLFSNVTVDSYSLIQDSVILPDVHIGQNVRVKRAIIDKGCHLPDDLIVGENIEDDARRFYVSPKGIVLITSDMLGEPRHRAR